MKFAGIIIVEVCGLKGIGCRFRFASFTVLLGPDAPKIHEL